MQGPCHGLHSACKIRNVQISQSLYHQAKVVYLLHSPTIIECATGINSNGKGQEANESPLADNCIVKMYGWMVIGTDKQQPIF